MTSVSFILLVVMVICFIAQMAVPWFTNAFIFDPSVAFSQPWRFITSIFLHGSAMHIFWNGYALFMFGSILERVVSKIQFLTLFFVSGIVGSLLYYLTIVFGLIPPIPALGASGAIYGILGALAILTPNLTLFFFFFPLRIKDAAILWVVLEFLGSFNASSGIASAAHLGGLVFGLLYGKYMKDQGAGYFE